MNLRLDFGYGSVPESSGELPKVGSNENVRIIKAEAKTVGNAGKPVIKLFGAFPDFDDEARWNATLWIPLNEGDAQRYARDCKTFLKTLRAFGAPDPKGMTPEDVADTLPGKVAQAKVCEPYGDSETFEAKFFKAAKGGAGAKGGGARPQKNNPADSGPSGFSSAPAGFGAAPARAGFGKRPSPQRPTARGFGS